MSIKFNMIGLFVINLQKMVAFYKDVIGIEIDWDGQGPYAEFKHEGIGFAMYEREKLPALLGKTPSYTNGINGTFELSINVEEPQNVDTTFQTMVDKGATAIYTPRDEPWRLRSGMIADPEGNLIEISSNFW